ncbi:hypothetical protein PPACK8108_LOCUS22978 [Phakopsora pachyrhizi]|uniref:Uncharacterized protein n=1 Tax=Phakopsora pachyrhizi TaxID=170000 RepID=A0AAV0BNX8_PHAPC|nr:hypothetical protein PPACK8108_LOCUS22978 [Phakopsora pachyrhizi]
MTSSTGAFQGKLWKICVVDLQQGLAWLCWAGKLSPRQVGQSGASRQAGQGQPGLDLAWLGQGQVGQTARWLGSVRMGRLGLGYGQAWLWAGKAGWGRLGLGYGQAGWGRLRLGYGQARLWAGKAGWGRLWLGPNGQAGAGCGSVRMGRLGQAVARSNGQAGAWLWAGKAGLAEAEKKGARWLGSVRMGRLGLGYGQAGWGRLRLGYGQAGARLWAGKAGKAGWGRLWLGPNGQAGAGWGSAIGRLGRLGLGYGQAVARSKWAGWGRLWLGQMGRLGLGYGQAGAWSEWAGKAGARWLGSVRMGRLGLGYGQVRQAGAWLWAGKAGWGRLRLGYGQAEAGWGRLGLGYGQAVARSEWAGWGKLGAESWEVFRKEILKTLSQIECQTLNHNKTHTQERQHNLRYESHEQCIEIDIKQAMGWLTAEYQEQMQAQKVIARERGKGQSDRRAGHTHTQAEGNRATESIKTEGRPNTRRKIEIPTGGAFRGGFAGRAGQGSAQLGFAGLVPRQVGQSGACWQAGQGQPGLDLAWLGQGQVGQTGRLGWVLDRLGSWGLTKGRLGMAGLEVGQTGQFKGRFDLQKPVKNETSTNSSCPRTPKMEKKPKKEKPPGIEENPPKGKTPPGKETSVKDGFKGKTPLAGKGNTVNFE